MSGRLYHECRSERGRGAVRELTISPLRSTPADVDQWGTPLRLLRVMPGPDYYENWGCEDCGFHVLVGVNIRNACEWRQPGEPGGWPADVWEAQCGTVWEFNNGGPIENRVRYCHGCGRRVEVVAE